MWLEKPSHQFYGDELVQARFNQNVEGLAFAIKGVPKINVLTVDPDEDLIQMLTRICPR